MEITLSINPMTAFSDFKFYYQSNFIEKMAKAIDKFFFFSKEINSLSIEEIENHVKDNINRIEILSVCYLIEDCSDLTKLLETKQQQLGLKRTEFQKVVLAINLNRLETIDEVLKQTYTLYKTAVDDLQHQVNTIEDYIKLLTLLNKLQYHEN